MTKTRASKNLPAPPLGEGGELREPAELREQGVPGLRIDPPHASASGTSASGASAAPPVAADAKPNLLDTEQAKVAFAPELTAAELFPAPLFQAPTAAANPQQQLALREEQLQLQAAQLATHLKARLTEVDRRESQLNARIAQLEADLRSARLWHREREHEYQQREGELCRQLEDLQLRAAEVERGEQQVHTIDERAEQIVQREQAQKDLDQQLRMRRQELDRQASAFSHAQSLWQLQQKHEEAAVRQKLEKAEELWTREVAETRQELEFEIAGRRRQLETAEATLREQRAALDQERADFERMRVQANNQLLRERKAWDAHQQTSQRELSSRLQEVESREAIVERQRVAMEQMRTEISLVHRQSLEMRLIAEQLWAQITGRLSSAEITRSIASLRMQLSQQYDQEQRALARQKDELVQLADRLQGQHAVLIAERQEVKNWGLARQAGIEQQARQLVEQEQQLESEQQDLRSARQQLHEDRRRYEQEIRELSDQLREASQLPAAA